MEIKDNFNYIEPDGNKPHDAKDPKRTFADSVDALTAADIPHAEPKKKKKRSALETVITDAVFIICVGVFVFCLYKIGSNLIDKYIGAKYYQSEINDFFDFSGDGDTPDRSGIGSGIAALAASRPSAHLADYDTALAQRGTDAQPTTDGKQSGQMAAIRAKLAAMKLKNDEIFGVIKVTGTNIAYTLVRHDDNDYYLTHSTDKKPLVIGSIFLDYKNGTVIGDNYNSVLYGHNMTSGQMFHELERFGSDISLFRESEIYIYTLEGIYVFKPFSFYRTDSRSDYIRTSFASPSEFTEWAENVKCRSLIKSDVTITEDSRILTLSTCINYSYNGQGRYSLHAILVEVIKD